ncbi:NB-ARC domain containing protein [Parasponia andersonii]|uniref:NB-ARC domain containing protein n=1 Tax=Parasponia andersonii TaxID=3476 RepID=A0A2P5AD03_PARAD|nr:NB-ARC domain containing protein [Parasponia andersonii]
MAESLLFILAEKVLGKLGSLAYEEITSTWGVKGDLKRLQRTLSYINAVLPDAEERQGESRELQLWLGQLKDVFHHADDVLDEMECEALRRQVLRTYGSANSKVRHFFSRSNPVAFRFKMGRRIKEVTTRLDEIAADRDKFHLVERVIDHGRSVVHVRREMTHSFVIASYVIGRSSDKEKVVFLLMYPENVQHVSVVSIVGIGGLGKTTLAKLVFNDDRVIGSFELTIWVCVSDYFDLKLLMVNIIKSVSGENCSDLDPDRLQVHLRQKLDGMKFLLVLDDVWNDDLEKWIELRNLLTAGAEGSKILVTTRSPSVASMMGTLPCHYLNGLADEEALTLLLKLAFKQGEEYKYPNLVEIGKDIVKKCGGVPLAVRTLGSLLYMKTDEKD